MRRVTLVIPLVFLAICAGCDTGGGKVRFPADDPRSFQWTGDFKSPRTDTKNLTWDTELDQARVTTTLDDFRGTIRIRVYDEAGVKIEDVEYSLLDENLGDLSETEITFPTDPGVWGIRIDLTDVVGDVKVLLDWPQ